MSVVQTAFRTLLLGVFLLALAACGSGEQQAASFYESGLKLVEGGQPAKAALEFRNAIKSQAVFPEAHLALGKAEEVLGHFDTAFSAYATALEQDPSLVEASARITYLLVAVGQLEEAIKYADDALARSPDAPAALIAKSVVELRLENSSEAVRLAATALEASPGNADAIMVLASERMMASDYPGAIAYLDQAPPEADRNLNLQVLRLAALDSNDDPAAVEALFQRLVGYFPDSHALGQGFVEWYLAEDRPGDAEKLLRDRAAASPDDDDVLFTLVDFLQRQKGVPAATTELEHRLAERSAKGGVTFRLSSALAILQFNGGDTATAIETMRTVITTVADGPDRNAARIQLATMELASGDSSSAALDLINEVLAGDGKNADALSVRASIRLAANSVPDAIEDLLTAINEAPQSGRLHVQLAEAYERLGSVSLAEEEYTKAFNLTQFDAETGLAMARFLLRYGKAEQAERVLETARTRTPDNPQLLTLLGDLKIASQDWVGAQEIANALRGLKATGLDLTADKITAAALTGLNRHTESISLLSASLTPERRGTVLADLIRAYVQAGRQPAAEEYLKSVLTEDPKNVQAHILLGSVYLSMSQPEAAEASFVAAAEFDSTGVGSAALAQYYLAVNDLKSAEAAVRKSIEENTDSIPLRLLLAAILERLERFDDAIAEYETLFQRDPQSTVVANDLASLLSERKGDKASLDRALEIAQRFVNSEVPQYLDTLGWIYYLRGDYDLALRTLQPAAGKLPQIALVQLHFGLALMRVGQTEAAIKTLEAAIALTPPLIAADSERARAAIESLKAPIEPSAAQ